MSGLEPLTNIGAIIGILTAIIFSITVLVGGTIVVLRWLDNGASSGDSSLPGPNRRPLPLPGSGDSAPAPPPTSPPPVQPPPRRGDNGAGRRPIPLPSTPPPRPATPDLAQVIEAHTIGLKRAGYEVSGCADTQGYILTVPLPSQHQSTQVYFVCEIGFPHSPPDLRVTIPDGFNSMGEITEKELTLPRLNTIATWSGQHKLLDVVRELETKLTKPNDFNQYGEIE